MRIAVTTLVFCVAALLSLGLVMLYSSSMTQVGAHYLIMQLIWGGVGFVLCVTAASLDYRLLKRIAWPLFGISIFLLAALLAARNRHIAGFSVPLKNGAHRWFSYKGIMVQPSELAKLSLIIVVAWYCERFQRQMPTFKRGILIPGILIGSLIGLIFVEPDRGTTVLLATVTGAMLLISGVRWKFLIPPALLGIAGFVVLILRDPVRMRRIFSWLDLEQHKEGAGYQAYQAMLALGSGGWTGVGLGNSRQKLGFVPFQQSDFILSIIGEELGLIATLLIVLAFVAIVICGMSIAMKARDTFGTLLASGLTLLIGLQAAINIGVVTSALPNKGLPLPFISYGGSNLVAMLVSVGLILSIARQTRLEEKIPVGEMEAGEVQPA